MPDPSRPDARLATLAAHARNALNSRGTLHGHQGSRPPRFELFHAASSICSQKVRAVLAYHDLSYVGHELSIFLGHTYLPGYVRLRMAGCAQLGGALVSHHSGSTSVAAGGCDGVVVPTLIDWWTEEVIVDSRRICIHLDEQARSAAPLRPAALAVDIDEELAIVDHLPNYQLLMGRTLSAAETPTTRDGVGGALSLKKVAWCDRYLQEHPDDQALVSAYAAKRAKELSAATGLFSQAAMTAAYASVEQALTVFDRKLADRRGRWLHGDELTMSDLFWSIELLRIRNVGAAHLWQAGRLMHIDKYLGAAEEIAAVRTAVVDWAGATF